MKLKEIKNGSIYYNTKKNRPERVISNTFSSSRVVTEFHGKNQSAVSTRHIRLANSVEVERYLDKTRKGNLMTFLGKIFSLKPTSWELVFFTSPTPQPTLGGCFLTNALSHWLSIGYGAGPPVPHA